MSRFYWHSPVRIGNELWQRIYVENYETPHYQTAVLVEDIVKAS